MSPGYSYHMEDEKIEEYRKLSTKDKLIWLEEINDLTRKTLTPKEMAFREKLRKGEI